MKFSKLKKGLAILLSAAMVFTCLPVYAFDGQMEESGIVSEAGGSEENLAEDEQAGDEAVEGTRGCRLCRRAGGRL